MIDFLRSNTWCTKEEYMWNMSVGQIRLSGIDFSHIEYLNNDAKKAEEENKNFKTFVIKDENDLKNVTDVGGRIVCNTKIRRK